MVPQRPDRAQEIARDGLILRVQSGSEVSGVALPGGSDHDEIGVCLEPVETVIGLECFEQYVYRSAGGPENPSQAGDLDLTVYSLRKFLAQAAKGNPNYLNVLYAPSESVLFSTPAGERLRAMTDKVVSQRAASPFLGYMISQREALVGNRAGANGKRAERMIAEFGFDSKYAAHMVRLGLQGFELLEKGSFTLPVPEADRTWLVELRQGKHSKEDALARADELIEGIRYLRLHPTGNLRPKPDRTAINEFLAREHLAHWS
jgi:hypothetical protein